MLYPLSIPKRGTSDYVIESIKVDFETFDFCPICNKEISPKFIHGSFTHSAKSMNVIDIVENSLVNVLYECPSCHNGIVVKYKPAFEIAKYSFGPGISKWNTFTIESIYPTPTASFPFDKIISKVSPKFEKIFTQSLQAKLDGKDELVGIGYRKSIEFLIKDYLIHINHEKTDKIPNMGLADCIKLIDSTKIQNLAKASTWLGNDETHYSKKHTDKDIEDLERFLNALVYFLTYELTADEAELFVNKWYF